MPQANLHDVKAVPLGRNAAFGYLDADVTKFAPNVIQHIFDYGLRQSLNDAIAERKDLSIREIADKAARRLATFYSGELRVRSASGEPFDPVENRAWKIAKAAVRTLAIATPQWKDKKIIGDLTGDDKLEAVLLARTKMINRIKLDEDTTATEYQINRYLTAHPNVREQARIAVEAEQSVEDNEFDI